MPSGIAVDAVSPRPVADFWCSVLGWHVVDADDGAISIGPADGAGPTIDVVGVAEGKAVTSWVALADPEGNEFCLLSRSVQEVTSHAR